MSLYRCKLCDRTLDSDDILICKLDDIEVCEDCYTEELDK